MNRLPIVAFFAVVAAFAYATLEACAPPPAPPIIEIMPGSAAASLQTPEASLRPVSQDFLPKVAGPHGISCSFSELRDSLMLRLHPEGAAAFVVRSSEMHIDIPSDPGAAAWISVERPQVALRAWAHAEDLPLYAKKPVVFGGFWSPQGSVPLAWHVDRRGALFVELAAVSGLTLHDHQEARVVCDGVAPHHGVVNPISAFALSPAYSTGVLAAGAHIALRVDPAEDPIAELDVTDPLFVQVYEQKKGFARITFALPEGVGLVWVEASAVGPAPRYGGNHYLRAPQRRSDYGTVEPMGELWRCNFAMPLGLELGLEKGLVGSIAPETTIELIAREGLVAHVGLPDASPWVAKVSDARWLVPSAKLAEPACKMIRADRR